METLNGWYIYPMKPIMFNWAFCRSVAETMELITNDLFRNRVSYCPTVEDFQQDWELAKQAARDQYWKGDFANGPVVFWLPTVGTFQYGFAFSQDETGAAFVYSPVELDYLEG